MYRSIIDEYKRPFTVTEKKLYIIMIIVISLDIISTYIIRKGMFETWKLGKILESNIVIAYIDTNFLVGILLYYSILIVIILFTKINREVEYTYLIAQILSNGFGSMENFSLILFHDTIVTNFLAKFNIGKVHVIMIGILAYFIISINQREHKVRLKTALKFMIGIITVLITQFAITVIWLKYLLSYFGSPNVA